MADLFDKNLKMNAPLADRMRPESFDDYFGQDKIISPNDPLRKAIDNDMLSSLILWGPPGSGKTTLAQIIAKLSDSHFSKFSAVVTGINEVRKSIAEAKDRLKYEKRKTILFIDEIHRFNKAQQDALLPYVEDGTVILIGATTENPSFEIISPLLSRSAVYILESLGKEAIVKILKRALKDKDKGLGNIKIEISKDAIDHLINYANGDARSALNALEFVVKYFFSIDIKKINSKNISTVLEKHALRYDKQGEEHYNIISAFIKSMRDSDPDAALYWLARMVEAGENPRFIARRMVIFSSEDIGNADPQALLIANAVAHAVEYVGFPEAQINLAQGVTYLASAPKDNASYSGLLKARQDAKKGAYGVPMNLRNAVTNLMKDVGYGKDYKYAHNDPKAKDQDHFPKEIGKQKYYFPKK
jgi:putative ATPase